jgi:hypothetical protein
LPAQYTLLFAPRETIQWTLSPTSNLCFQSSAKPDSSFAHMHNLGRKFYCARSIISDTR